MEHQDKNNKHRFLASHLVSLILKGVHVFALLLLIIGIFFSNKIVLDSMQAKSIIQLVTTPLILGLAPYGAYLLPFLLLSAGVIIYCL
jgi:hypothetical protein